MIYTCYFVPKAGIHPTASVDIYEKLWPIMLKSVHKLGHKLVHITDSTTPSWGDSVYRVPGLDADTTIYSRDVAWLHYLRHLPIGEQACMIEPDTYMLREMPPLATGCNMALLTRPSKQVPGWFRLSTRRAVTFYQALVDHYQDLSREQHVFHGDIIALHRALGLPENGKAHWIPSYAHGAHIESRNWLQYGFRKGGGNPVMWQFKGTSKDEMLALA